MIPRAGAQSLRSNVVSALVGNLAYTLSQFLMLILLAHLTDVATVGDYAYALAVAAPIFIFSSLKLRHVQVTDARGENSSGEFFALRAVSSVVALGGLGIVAAATNASSDAILLLLTVGVFKAVESQLDIMYGAMQRIERLDLVARSLVARAALGFVAFAFTVWQTGTASAGMLTLSALTGMVGLHDAQVLHRLGISTRPQFAWRRLASLTWLAAPLGLSIAIGSFTSNLPRYFIKYFEDSQALGVFAAISYVLVATAMIAGSAAEAASPRLANLYAAGDTRRFNALTRKLATLGLGLGLLGVVGALLFGRVVLDLAFGTEYGKEWRLLVVLMIGATMQFVSLSVGAAIYGMRLFRAQVPVNVMGLAVAGVAGWFLTASHGLAGAAWSVVAMQTAMGLSYAWLYYRRMRRPG